MNLFSIGCLFFPCEEKCLNMLIFILWVIINYKVAGAFLVGCLQWLSVQTKQLLGRYRRKAPGVLPSCFLLLARVEIFMHREGNEALTSKFLSSCLLRKHCFLDSPQSVTQLRLGIDTHTISSLFASCFLLAILWQVESNSSFWAVLPAENALCV